MPEEQDLKKDQEVIEDTQLEEEGDVVFEENIEVTGADTKIKIEKTKKRIKELEEQNAKLLDGWQRDKAEFVNARRQDEEARQNFMKFANEDMVIELLPVLDSFESAFKNKEAWEKIDKNWRVGVEYIYNQFISILNQRGVQAINPIGELFDPKRDEAIENIKVENESDSGKVIEVLSFGYKLHEKIIRAPKVKVGEYSK